MDGIHAEDDETDDVFDEAIGPTGQVLKFPSAISIEDRHSSLKRDWSLAESRMTSGVSFAAPKPCCLTTPDSRMLSHLHPLQSSHFLQQLNLMSQPVNNDPSKPKSGRALQIKRSAPPLWTTLFFALFRVRVNPKLESVVAWTLKCLRTHANEAF